jgi:hypothetical protein
MFEDFPDKPKGMHWRTYDRLRGRYDMAEARSMAGLEHFLNRLDPTPQGSDMIFVRSGIKEDTVR